MGAWDTRPFQNDPACDWAIELEEAEGLEFLADSLDQEEVDDYYLEIDGGCVIIAVAEVIYGIKFGPRDLLPDAVTDWIERHRDLDVSPIIPKCIEKVERVMGDHSETRQGWEHLPEVLAAWESDCKFLTESLKR